MLRVFVATFAGAVAAFSISAGTSHAGLADVRLVPDGRVNRELWEDAGGVFVLHRSAAETIPQVLAEFEG